LSIYRKIVKIQYNYFRNEIFNNNTFVLVNSLLKSVKINMYKNKKNLDLTTVVQSNKLQTFIQIFT